MPRRQTLYSKQMLMQLQICYMCKTGISLQMDLLYQLYEVMKCHCCVYSLIFLSLRGQKFVSKGLDIPSFL